MEDGRKRREGEGLGTCDFQHKQRIPFVREGRRSRRKDAVCSVDLGAGATEEGARLINEFAICRESKSRPRKWQALSSWSCPAGPARFFPKLRQDTGLGILRAAARDGEQFSLREPQRRNRQHKIRAQIFQTLREFFVLTVFQLPGG